LKYSCSERVALTVRNKIEYSNSIELLKTDNKIKYSCKLMLLKIQIEIGKTATEILFNIEKLYLKLLFLNLKYYFSRYNILSIFSSDSNKYSVLYTDVLFEISNSFKKNVDK